MFEELVKATKQIIAENEFNHFVLNFAIIHGQQFEVYWNNLIKNKLNENGVQGINNVNTIIQGHGPRQFDLAWNQNRQWNVCEFGHERSGRGYLQGEGRPDNMGLINKWFFDYCRNYFQPRVPLNPRSYTYLYFSLEEGYDETKMKEMFDFIKKVANSVNLNNECIDVIKDGIIKGKIIIIDAVDDFEKVREMCQKKPELKNYIRPEEGGWDKSDLLFSQNNLAPSKSENQIPLKTNVTIKNMDTINFEIITLDWKTANYNEFPSLPGVYQIYGTSPLYGINTLLYIGQSKDLKSRIKAHIDSKDGVIGRQANLNCRYATAAEELLDVIEQTLVVMHKPSFNSIGLKNVSQSVREKGYYIQNHGERGLLNLETTNYYFFNHLNQIVD